MSLYETKLLTLFHLRLDVSNFLVLQYKTDQRRLEKGSFL